MGKHRILLVASASALAACLAVSPGVFAQTGFEFHRQFASDEMKLGAARLAQVQWASDVTAPERREIATLFSDHKWGLDLFSASRVLKTDLDGDSDADYVVTAFVAEPQPFYYGEALVAVTRSPAGLSRIVIESPVDDTGLGVRRIEFVDIDADGLRDIVDQRAFDVGANEPNFYQIIFKNERTSFSVVYRRNTYDFLRLEDGNQDGRIDVIEAMNESGVDTTPSIVWSNIYTWSKTGLVPDPARFRTFYTRRLAEYRRQLAEEESSNASFIKQVGKPNPDAVRNIEALKTYIQRTEGLLRARP